MKTILKFILILIFISCKAQNIVPLYKQEDSNTPSIKKSDCYKDVGNDFNPYIGTWTGTLNNGSLTITFNKVVQYDDGNDLSDFFVGEYRYSENGAVLVDTYPQLVSTDPNRVRIIVKPNPSHNNIESEYLMSPTGPPFPPCPECPQNTRFVVLSLIAPNRPNRIGDIKMARFVENGIEKIRMRVANAMDVDGAFTGYFSIPENSIWTLIKEE